MLGGIGYDQTQSSRHLVSANMFLQYLTYMYLQYLTISSSASQVDVVRRNGLKPLTDAVKADGLVPGIWLAPAALTTGSRVAKERHDGIGKKVSQKDKLPRGPGGLMLEGNGCKH